MRFWLAEAPLLLASQSKIRQAMLAAAGVPLEICPAALDERAVEKKAASAPAAAALLAREKALAVARRFPGRLTLGADQTLALGEQRFRKPVSRTAAQAQLHALRGRTHELHSSIAFVRDDQVLFESTDSARLAMRALSDRFIELYLDAAADAATASVGAYQLEGLGAQLFARVDGDYFTVLGLPLLVVLDFLRRHGCLAS
jgi:septum formation protein